MDLVKLLVNSQYMVLIVFLYTWSQKWKNKIWKNPTIYSSI